MRNMCTSPYITGQTTYGWNIESQQRADGLWQYSVKDTINYKRGTVRATMYTTATDINDILVVVYECDNPQRLVGMNAEGNYCMRGCDFVRGGTIGDRVGWNACRIVDKTFANHEFVIHTDCNFVTLLGCANYTAQDWQTVDASIGKHLPTAWSAPPRDTPTGVKAPAVLTPL